MSHTQDVKKVKVKIYLDYPSRENPYKKDSRKYKMWDRLIHHQDQINKTMSSFKMNKNTPA